MIENVKPTRKVTANPVEQLIQSELDLTESSKPSENIFQRGIMSHDPFKMNQEVY